MSTRTASRFVLTAMLLLIPSMALALDMEFYVWGGHDAVVNAFSKLALIFGDNAYKSLYFVVITAGLFFGGVTVFAKSLGTANGSVMTWIVPTMIGIMVYLALVVPKGTIHVYDPVFNKNQAVGGIPDGVVAVAGILNKIERGLVDIVTTAGDPLNYQTQAGGKGFLGLAQLTSIPLSAVDSNLDASMRRYVKDCVSYALMNPNAGLTVDELRKATTNFVGSLDKAVNPAIWTVYYDAANPQGQALTCTDSWTSIKAALTPANLDKNIQSVCANLGYDVADAAAMIQCKTVLNNVNSGIGLGAASIDDFLKQAYVSQRLEEIFRSGNASGATNYQFLLNASGAMKSANEWLPILKAALTAIAVGLLPFLALFIPTPLIGKAVGIIAGFFIWLTAWGVTDAIVHQFAVDYANRAYEMVRQNKLGMDALYFFPDQTVKILGMFGTLRMSGMMLATVITGMLIKFGGHAMAMMAGGMVSQVQSAGTRATHEVEDPAGRASAMQRNVTAMPTQAWSNEHSFQARQAQSLVGMSGKTTASSDMIRDFGMEFSSRISADSEIGRSIGFGGSGRAMREGGLSSAYELKSFDGRLGLDKSAATKNVVSGSYGGDTLEFAKMGVANDRALANVFGSGENYAGFLTANMDKSVGQLQGEMGAYAAARSLGFNGNWREFNAMRSEVTALGDFANAEAVNKIADNYGISSGQLMQMNAQFQQSKHASEVTGLSNQLGGPVAAGTEAGNVVATETGGKIQGIYAGGGYDNYQQLTSNDVSGRIARNQLVHAAADQMVGRIAPQLKNDPEMYQNGHLTERGFAEMQKAMEGQNINFTTSDGKSAVNVGMDGGIVNSSDAGTVAKGDRGQALELQKQLRSAGFQSAAAHVARMSGQAFDYKADFDRNGNLASFSIDQGGRVQKFDLGQSRTGTDMERLDRNVSTVDKGLRKTVGDFIKTGYENQSLNVSRKSGSYMIQAGGKQMMVNGDWYYAKNDKTGKMEVVGGSFSNGLDGNVLMYAKDKDGNLHYSQVQGKMDKSGNLVAGRRSEITEDQFVQMSQQGAAVVSTRSGGGITGSIHADGGVKADYTSRQTTGYAVSAIGDHASSFASQEFKEGRSIDAGSVATTLAIGRNAIGETASIFSDAATVASPVRAAMGRRQLMESATKREAENAERDASVRVQQNLQRTSKILQNQSKSSPLPKGGGPAPLRGPRR
ncbi:MAG: conjugal transfer protein TraG N-terminal domain-containing protein [Geobacteraceae bacterium]|nr:conjugal transfer protein TraG N-terminal domain-containing protein [Geobacteraceae bacterium]